MKKKLNLSSAKLVIAMLLVVLGMGSVVVAQTGGGTVLSDTIRLLELVRELGNTPSNVKVTAVSQNGGVLGFVTTADDVQTANFNNLALQTNSDSGKSGYVNAVFEYMDTTNGAASTTPISIKNTWAQDVVAEWALVLPVGTPTTTIAFYAGTSTLSGVAYNATTALPTCLMNGKLVVTSTRMLVSSLDPAGTGVEKGSCIVRPDEYFLLYQRSTDPRWAVTTTADTGADYKFSVRIRVISTSTVQY